MSNRDRVVLFVVGFVLGMFLVSFILQRRARSEDVAEDPWADHHTADLNAGVEPLPESVPAALRSGRIIDFGYLPDKANAQERVWHLNFDRSYPYVRVSEHLSTGEFKWMAADQVMIELADGVDVTALKPMLDALGLRLRMFNRKEKIAVIGVLTTEVDAVPATIEATKPYADLFSNVRPDFIEIKQH